MSPSAAHKLMHQLARTLEQEYTCDDVLRVLDQFAEAILRGEDAGRWMPLVAHHLEDCADCREEFEALMRVLRASPA
jgi:hypothetical protein